MYPPPQTLCRATLFKATFAIGAGILGVLFFAHAATAIEFSSKYRSAASFEGCPKKVSSFECKTKPGTAARRFCGGASQSDCKTEAAAALPPKPSSEATLDCQECSWNEAVAPAPVPPEVSPEPSCTSSCGDGTWSACANGKQTQSCTNSCTGAYQNSRDCSCPANTYTCRSSYGYPVDCSQLTGSTRTVVEITCDIDTPKQSCRANDPDEKKDSTTCEVCSIASSDYTCDPWQNPTSCNASGKALQTRSCTIRGGRNCIIAQNEIIETRNYEDIWQCSWSSCSAETPTQRYSCALKTGFTAAACTNAAQKPNEIEQSCSTYKPPVSDGGSVLPTGIKGQTLAYIDISGGEKGWKANSFLYNDLSRITVGAGSAAVGTKLTILGGNEATLQKDSGFLQIGADNQPGNQNLAIDWQSIQSRNASGAAKNLLLNPRGGNVGIGTTTPNVDLHIRGDSVSAELRLEPSNWSATGHFGFLRFGPARDPNHYIRSGWGTGMLFHDTDKYIFDGGNVGIGTFTPREKLDVNGGIAVAPGNTITSGAGRLELSGALRLSETRLDNYQGVAINSSGGKTTIGKGVSVEGASAVLDIQQEKQSPDPATAATISAVGTLPQVFFDDKEHTDVRVILSVGDTLYANGEERTVTAFLSGNDAQRMVRINKPFSSPFNKQRFEYLSPALFRASDINKATQFSIDTTGTVSIAGKVGIGTVSPNRQLHVKTKQGTNAEIDIQSGGTMHWGIYHDEASDDLRFWHFNDRFVLTKEGQLTIAALNATNLKTNTLTVGSQSKIGQYLRASGTTGEAAWADLPSSSQWITNGTAIHYPTGNVGIGTGNPTALLDVQPSQVPLKHPRIQALVIQTDQPTDPLDGYLSASGGNRKFTPEIQVGDTIRLNNLIRIVTAIVPKPGYPNEELLKTDSPLPFTGQLYDIYYRKSAARFGSSVISSDGGTIIPRERMKIEGSILVQNDHSPSLAIDRSRKWEASSGYMKWAGNGTNYWALGLDANATNNLYLKYRPNTGTGEPSAVALTVLNDNGNVGIGTNNPIGKLQIQNKIYTVVGEVAEDNPTIRCSWDKDGKKATPPATAKEDIGYRCIDLFDPPVVNGVASLYGKATLYEVKQNDSFIVASSGNVGIGTNNPGGTRLAIVGNPDVAGPQPLLKIAASNGGTAALDIGGQGNQYWRIASDQNLYGKSYEQGRLRIRPTINTGSNVDPAANEENLGITIKKNGFVGINNQNPNMELDVRGDINVAFKGSNLANGAKEHLAFATDRIGLDLAEIYFVEEDVEVGDVLVASPHERLLKKSSRAYEEEIIGVVSGAPALLFEGSELTIGPRLDRFTKGKKPPVALAGRVPVKVSLENGPIVVGDYLTSSSRPGIAMRATEPGIAIGIALEAYSGTGSATVLTFINIGEKNVSSRLKELEREIVELKTHLKK